MMQSVDAFVTHWRKHMIASYGRDLAVLALDRAREYVLLAKTAEEEGRIRDMQPLMAVPNIDNPKLAEGYFFLEIRYHPVLDGHKQDRASYTVAILKPKDHPKAKKTIDPVELMFAG